MPLHSILGSGFSRFIFRLVATASTVLFIHSSAAGFVVPAELLGDWTGNARIIVSWCQQTNLTLSISIREDGTVSGKIGDATLVDGRLCRNRGWLGRKLNIKTDYLITGSLDGSIVADEQITRRGVSIPFNFDGSNLVGGLHTTGTHIGGKQSMVLSAASLNLKRVAPVVGK